jgi:hypothetical protein
VKDADARQEAELDRLLRDRERPEITAWLAMTVASVARITSGRRAQSGAIRKNGFSTMAGLRSSSADWPA